MGIRLTDDQIRRGLADPCDGVRRRAMEEAHHRYCGRIIAALPPVAGIDREGAVQQAFLKLWRIVPKELETVPGWLLRVARNHVLSVLRRKKRLHFQSLDELVQAPTWLPELAVDADVSVEVLREQVRVAIHEYIGLALSLETTRSLSTEFLCRVADQHLDGRSTRDMERLLETKRWKILVALGLFETRVRHLITHDLIHSRRA